MNNARWAALVLVSMLPGVATADCAMSYDMFEMTIPHLDLDTCPADLTRDATFCRAAVALHGVAVFQFEVDGERCLVSVSRFEEDEVELIVQR